MTDDPLTDLLGEIRRIADPVERARRYTEIIENLGVMTTMASEGRREALNEAIHVQGRPQTEVAKALGLTPARINQMLKPKDGPPAERVLLAPDTGVSVAVAVVEKRDRETGQPVTASSTNEAFRKLNELAAAMGVGTEEERIPPPGLIDLNRNNLAVLIGPRISSLIAQVVASDPVIQWRRDNRNHWYLVDTRTSQEYRSDFDDGWAPAKQGARQCIAHIGRIRRPDGQGSFLYLGGAHAAGTAGAVDVFVREFSSIWDQAKKSLWSAIVTTRADENGNVISANLATSLYVHGKR